MEIFSQIPPYYVVAALIALAGVIFTVHKTKQTKLMEFEEARRVKKEELERDEKKEREIAISEYKEKLDDIRENFTRLNIQSMALSKDEPASIKASYDTVVSDIRRMRASPLLNDAETQKSLDKLEELAGDFMNTLIWKSLNRHSGQNEAADAHLATANRIIGQAHVKVDEIKEKLRNM